MSYRQVAARCDSANARFLSLAASAAAYSTLQLVVWHAAASLRRTLPCPALALALRWPCAASAQAHAAVHPAVHRQPRRWAGALSETVARLCWAHRVLGAYARRHPGPAVAVARALEPQPAARRQPQRRRRGACVTRACSRIGSHGSGTSSVDRAASASAATPTTAAAAAAVRVPSSLVG